MVATGWLTAEEMPASQHLRSVAAILAEQPTTREERDAERAERAEDDERRARIQDTADTVAAVNFMRSVRGEAPKTAADVLAEAGRDPVGRQDGHRRRAAIEILKVHGLADVITGGDSGCVIDVNMGVLEPVGDERARAEMDRRYAFERSEREAEQRTREVNRYRAALDAKLLARGLGRSR